MKRFLVFCFNRLQNVFTILVLHDHQQTVTFRFTSMWADLTELFGVGKKQVPLEYTTTT